MTRNNERNEWQETFSYLFGGIFTSGRIEQCAKVLIDEIGGRLAGTESGRAAEVFVKKELEEAGLDQVKLETFPLQGWERGDCRLEVIRPKRKRIHALALGLSCGTPADGVAGSVEDLGYGAPELFRQRADSVRGKWALVEEGGAKKGPKWHRAVKMSAAQDAGALGLVLISGESGDIPKTGTCQFGRLSSIPGVGISREDGLAIQRLIASGQTVEFDLCMENQSFDAKASNVIGLLEGREKRDELVCVGGHLDSWDIADGAMDNGSGALVTLAAARALAGLPQRPRRTVAFGLFMGEETGLLGSEHHVHRHEEKLDSIVSYLNLDIVSEPIGLACGGEKAHFPLLEEVARHLAPLGVDDHVSRDISLHSDHVNFLLKGVPTLSWRCAFEHGTTRYCHSRADTAEKIDLKGLHLCACATSALLFALAEEPDRPATRISLDDVEDMLVRGNLKEALIHEGAWPF